MNGLHSVTKTGTQDFQSFANVYRQLYPDDVVHIREPLQDGRDVTALVATLAEKGRTPMLVCDQVPGSEVPLVTNVFASRERIARIFGTRISELHGEYQKRANALIEPEYVADGR